MKSSYCNNVERPPGVEQSDVPVCRLPAGGRQRGGGPGSSGDHQGGSLYGEQLSFSTLRLLQFCESLGWRGKGTSFDFLPILLSGADGEPRYYDLPEHLCMKVGSCEL